MLLTVLSRTLRVEEAAWLWYRVGKLKRCLASKSLVACGRELQR